MAILIEAPVVTMVRPVNQFRLTGVSNTAVMVSNSVVLSTIYLTPYTGNHISLFDAGGTLVYVKSGEVSLAVTGRTANLPFDVFGYLNARSLKLEFADWSGPTTRTTGLTRVDGIWTKTGDSTRRYLGTCRPRSATTFHYVPTLDVSKSSKIDLWNCDNRVDSAMMYDTGTASWTYSVATVRQANASALFQCEFVVGLQEDHVSARLGSIASVASTSIDAFASVGIGYDTTTEFSSAVVAKRTSGVSGQLLFLYAEHAVQPTAGIHYFAWCEAAQTIAAVTFHGLSGGIRSGLTVNLRA